MDDNGRGKLIQKSRAPGAVFDLYKGDGISDYADGVGRMHVSAANVRLQFYKVFDVENGQDENGKAAPLEQRVVSQDIVMPTRPFIEWLAHVVSTIKSDQANFENIYDAEKDKIRTVLENIELKSLKDK